METGKSKTQITVQDSERSMDFFVSSRNIGSVLGFPFDKAGDKRPRYHYRVTVKYGRKQFTEDYYTSINDYDNGKDTMDSEDHTFALQCLTDDARTGGLCTFEEFCGEFGYDDCRESRRIHSACQRIYEKFQSLGIEDEDDLNFIGNRLNGDAGTDYKITAI
jgi:hypothetical protein